MATGTPTGTPLGTGTLHTEDLGSFAQENRELSVLGEDFDSTPMVFRIRAHLDSVERLLEGGENIGRGLGREHSQRAGAAITTKRPRLVVTLQSLDSVMRSYKTRSYMHPCGPCLVLVSSATAGQARGATEMFQSKNSERHILQRTIAQIGPPPDARILDYVARLREEPESGDGSSPDEGVPGKHAGHHGVGKPIQVGVGYVQRDFCDGRSLASPGRWAPASRVYPSTTHWRCISDTFQWFTDTYGTQDLLVSLAMVKVDKCPFLPDEVASLKKELIDSAALYGFRLERRIGDRSDVPIDYRFLHVLLQ